LGSNLAQHLPLPFDHVVRAWFYRLECQVVVDSRKSLLPDCASGLQPLRLFSAATAGCQQQMLEIAREYVATLQRSSAMRPRPRAALPPPFATRTVDFRVAPSPPVDIVSAPPWSDPVVPARDGIRCTTGPSAVFASRRQAVRKRRPPSTANNCVCLMTNVTWYAQNLPYSKPANFIQYLAYRVG
jgi:hypothetical protein